MLLGDDQFAALVCEQEPLLKLRSAHNVRCHHSYKSNLDTDTNVHHTDDCMRPD